MVEFALPANSRVGVGKTWAAPAGATRVKNFSVYRWNPDDGQNPRLDTFLDRPQRLRTDGVGCVEQDQERDRADAHLSPLVPRGHLRILRDEHRRHRLARLHQEINEIKGDVRIYPLPHMPVIKDLVPNLDSRPRAIPLDRAIVPLTGC